MFKKKLLLYWPSFASVSSCSAILRSVDLAFVAFETILHVLPWSDRCLASQRAPALPNYWLLLVFIINFSFQEIYFILGVQSLVTTVLTELHEPKVMGFYDNNSINGSLCIHKIMMLHIVLNTIYELVWIRTEFQFQPDFFFPVIHFSPPSFTK